MNTIVIVEGKSDTNRLKAIYKDIQTYETSGLGIDQKKIQHLKSIQNEFKLIVFTDPDGPGEIIRNILIENIENLHHAYLPNDKALSKNKKSIGVEHAKEKDIKKALENLYTINKESTYNYTLDDLIDIGIYFDKNKRLEFCNYLHIAYGNNKKVLKQLNNFNIKPEKIKNFLKDNNGTSKHPLN